jgi:hypothetical protein
MKLYKGNSSMPYNFLLRILILSLAAAAHNAAAADIHWDLNNSPIQIDSNIVIPPGDILSMDAGTEIQFSKDVGVTIEGKIEVIGQGDAILTSRNGDNWLGLDIQSDEEFTISNLRISNANIAIKLTSSPNVTLSDNHFENNLTAISLSTDDGVRSNINTIADNEIRNNDTGIIASSTGANIQSNLIANNSNFGINLTGRSCGGGSACGWRSIIQNNLISGSEIGVSVFGHHLTMNNNDIYNSIVGIANRNLNTTLYNVTDNNIVGWSAFAYANGSSNSVNAGNIWLGQPASEQAVCDIEENDSLGFVTFNAASEAFSTTHNFDLPPSIDSETRAAHSSCPLAERIEEDFIAVSISAGLNEQSSPSLTFNIALSNKFSNAKFIQVLYWPVNAEQKSINIARSNPDESFSTTLLLPEFAKSGVYEIREIVAVDNTGRKINVDYNYLNQGGYDYRTVLDNENSDEQPPELQGMTSSAPYFDESEQLHIDFNLSAGDNLSGLNSIFVIELYSPTGKSIQKRGSFAEDGLLQGSAELDFVLPKYSASGDYRVKTVRLFDLAGNINHSEQWIADNFSWISIDNPNSDNIPPTLESVTLLAEFDLIAKRPVINVSVTTRDDSSGVASSYVRLRKPGGGLLANSMLKDIENSNEFSGRAVFTASFALTNKYDAGDYLVIDFCITDEANNENCYYTAELIDMQFQDRLNINYFDADSDGIPDLYDLYPLIAISGLLDTDGDGAPDECGSICQGLGMGADDDDDNDGVADIDDAFPLDPNTSLDTDLDGIANSVDIDDDGDGIPDIYELANGLNPLDSLDGALDMDGDGLSNFDEFRFGTNINNADTDEDGLTDDIDNNPLVFDEDEPTLYDGQFIIVPDLSADGVKELGVLSINSELSQVQLEVLDGKTQESIRIIVWSDIYTDVTLSIDVIDDMNANGVSEVGLFGLRDSLNNEGRPQMFVRDLLTGNRVKVFNWPANWKQTKAVVLTDMTGDGIPEIGLQGRFIEGSRPQLVVKSGSSTATVDTFGYPNLFNDPQFYQHSDMDNDGISEISTFGRIARNNKIQIKIASGVDSKDRLKAYNFPDKWEDISWVKLDDSNGDDIADWGLFGTNKQDGRPQLIVKNGTDPRGALRLHAWPSAILSAKFFAIPDINGDGVDEVAAAGLRTNGRHQFQIQDGVDRNSVLVNYNLNLNIQNVSYHVLPDLTDDGLAEIGFMGVNSDGEYELIIRDGDPSKGQLRVDNFGSDWSQAPTIANIGDINDDGTPKLLVSGQNAEGLLSIITL